MLSPGILNRPKKCRLSCLEWVILSPKSVKCIHSATGTKRLDIFGHGHHSWNDSPSPGSICHAPHKVGHGTAWSSGQEQCPLAPRCHRWSPPVQPGNDPQKPSIASHLRSSLYSVSSSSTRSMICLHTAGECVKIWLLRKSPIAGLFHLTAALAQER